MRPHSENGYYRKSIDKVDQGRKYANNVVIFDLREPKLHFHDNQSEFHMTYFKSALTLGLLFAASPVLAFDTWTEQKFSLFGGNTWKASAKSVSMTSEASVSMLWTAVPENDWTKTKASWSWEVAQSVPPTPLDRKGVDDRNLAVYFVFMPENVARQVQGKSITKLLSVDEGRVLTFVWGGDYDRGAVLTSPYLGARGRTIALRPAGTGNFTEDIDLSKTYRRIFGGDPGVLVGLAVSGDSDDTDSVIKAKLSSLVLR